MKIRGILHENALGYWLSTTPLVKDYGVILCLAEQVKEIKNLHDSLVAWQALPHTPKRNILTWTADNDLTPLLTTITGKEPSIIIADVSLTEQKLPERKSWMLGRLILKLGESATPRSLVDQLIQKGYEANAAIYENYQVAMRGNLVDVGLGDKIIRLECDGNTISNIWQLDRDSQNIESSLTEIKLPQRHWIQKNSSIADYLAESICLIGRRSIGHNHEFILDDFAENPDIHLHQSWPDLSTTLPPAINLERLKQQSASAIFWMTHNPPAAEKLIQRSGKAVTVLPLPTNTWQLPAAFYDNGNNILVINDSYFFPSEIKTGSSARVFLPEIQVGDLVVHRDHGVGRLKEFSTINLDGIKRDYLILEYADNDKIYLPTENSAKISKYLGPANPKISRLSTDQGWLLTIQKIKAETLQLALSLLNTEARRRLIHCQPLRADDREALVAADFPYEETPSQKRAMEEVLSDLTKDYPTDRLLCGDVGFGKTEVALRAAWRTVLNGGQVAILCPTTILAQQHYDLFQQRLSKHGANIGLLSRWQNKNEVENVIKGITDGSINIVIGTHRALSADVRFASLRLLIIDEEQNFGVKDKEKLKQLSQATHILSLSATPIPRTLHLALSPLKNISLLTDPPRGRHNIITTVKPWNTTTIQQACEYEISRGGQIYYLHNKVETIELAAKDLQLLLPKARIAIAHGQMEDKKLADTMHTFDQGQTDILVCSTIISNGLDLPNVNTIIINDAAHFGLSQLHQLRGRVGRSDRQAYCYLLHREQKLQGDALERLRTLADTSELGAGFRIASRDMELRGVGQIIGNRQHGHLRTIGLNLYEDLLQAAVDDLQNRQRKTWRDIDIDLPLQQSISGDYFENDSAKIYFWQEISLLTNLDELSRKEATYTGAPESISNVFYLQRLRILAQDTPIIKISSRSTGADAWIELIVKQLSPFQLQRLLTINDDWLIKPGSMKIKQSQLGADWKKSLELSIASLSEA